MSGIFSACSIDVGYISGFANTRLQDVQQMHAASSPTLSIFPWVLIPMQLQPTNTAVLQI